MEGEQSEPWLYSNGQQLNLTEKWKLLTRLVRFRLRPVALLLK